MKFIRHLLTQVFLLFALCPMLYALEREMGIEPTALSLGS